jgi:HEPN domain-containing protein
MAKKTKRVSVTPDNAGKYLSKASEYMRTSFAAIANEDYHAACLNAVHAVIMANDAITVFHGGKRSSSEDHRDATNLLREIAPPGAVDWDTQATRLGRIIAQKSPVAYGVEIITAKSADTLVKQAERFVGWAKEVVPI